MIAMPKARLCPRVTGGIAVFDPNLDCANWIKGASINAKRGVRMIKPSTLTIPNFINCEPSGFAFDSG